MKKRWYDYLWIYEIVYFSLGFFNILFAWLGMIDFLLPLCLAVFGGNKWFCSMAVRAAVHETWQPDEMLEK